MDIRNGSPFPTVEEFERLGGIELLLRVISYAAEYGNYTARCIGISNYYCILYEASTRNMHIHMCSYSHVILHIAYHRNETLKFVFDSLSVCATLPSVMLKLCEPVKLVDGTTIPGIRYHDISAILNTGTGIQYIFVLYFTYSYVGTHMLFIVQ